MKKYKKDAQPMLPATDHPTGIMKPGAIFNLFSLVNSPPPVFQYQPRFHSYDLGELKKELGRVEALKKQPKVKLSTEPLRKQIELIELLHIPNDGLTFLKWRFEEADAFESELIYLLAKKGNVEASEAYSRKIYNHFWYLKQLAIDGHAEALQALAILAIEATEVVNQHAVKHPEVFISIASRQTHWPFLKSRHKQLNLIKTEDEDSMLGRLKLGKNTQQDLAPANRYQPNTPTTEIAQKLLDYVRSLREYSKFIHRGKFLKAAQALDYLTRAGQLPEPAQDSKAAEAWWQLARLILLESYPRLDPGSDANLNTIAPTLLKVSQVADPKKRRNRILYNLERAFMTILAKPPDSIRVSS